ncbi:IS66 family insertion sequence element accessory protein TnpB [Xenorhabdus bovienii]|uniref:IS66 family insertion sequence element accessory protein TnpB n=1 Tax=Xenorhabdus bovienii TaxID=40576 RepID=UPI0023B208BA|nr:IS66 family insertion sequence element accessory protein TnpB [Xenorhabdus bovienii]MDE9430633.1 IS66 family insertion sequence element accessory protein TnpB [Xenorhabdus bovienii]
MKMFVDVPDVYLCRSFIDFRKSINGLAVWVELEMQLSPTQTALFLFCNKKRDCSDVMDVPLFSCKQCHR